jgi:hypothetical protein
MLIDRSNMSNSEIVNYIGAEIFGEKWFSDEFTGNGYIDFRHDDINIKFFKKTNPNENIILMIPMSEVILNIEELIKKIKDSYKKHPLLSEQKMIEVLASKGES